MSETTKTLYTMSQIKDYVRGLCYKAQEEFRKNLRIEFEKKVEENAEISMDLSAWGKMCANMRVLETKYRSEGRYYSTPEPNRLKDIMRDAFMDSCNPEYRKIDTQFTAILNRLKNIRKSDVALEFLKACGIELPENSAPAINIPVDPEFIKSILPKQNLLESGTGDVEA